jgi:hypothetical protein
MPPRLDRQQLRALANYFRIFHGNKSFLDALAEARSLSENGALKSPVWNQIAEEIAAMEASAARPAVASGILSALLAFRRRRSLLLERYPADTH